MKIRVTGTALAIALCMALPATASANPGAAAKPKGSESERLQKALNKLVNKVDGGPPGASIVLRHGRRQTFLTAGYADVESKARFRPGKQMRIASVSKAFSGAVALSLVESGDLDLDQSITTSVPTLPSAWSAVTLRQLLDHTSGLPNFTTDPGFQEFFGNNLHGTATKQELVDFVADQPLVFPAGTDYAYSNTDNIVIAMIAEAATGETYNELLDRLVKQPLGLRRTDLPSGFELPSPRINGYDTMPLEDLTECCSMSFVNASGGIYSTPRSLSLFVSGYGGGKLFGKRTRAEQFDWIRGGGSEPSGPGKNSAGLGIFRYQLNCGTMFGHTGNFPGYTQFIATNRNGRRSVVVSANRQLAPDAPGVDAPAAFKKLHRMFARAACTALRA